MARKKQKKFVTLKEITIPAGTVFYEAPVKTERPGPNHGQALIGLTDNSCGFFDYYIDPTDPGLMEYFTELKE